VGEEWFEKQLDIYRIQMMGLTASDVRRDSKAVQKIAPIEKPKEVAATATNSR
jgi:hypothetical protein